MKFLKTIIIILAILFSFDLMEDVYCTESDKSEEKRSYLSYIKDNAQKLIIIIVVITVGIVLVKYGQDLQSFFIDTLSDLEKEKHIKDMAIKIKAYADENGVFTFQTYDKSFIDAIIKEHPVECLKCREDYYTLFSMASEGEMRSRITNLLSLYEAELKELPQKLTPYTKEEE